MWASKSKRHGRLEESLIFVTLGEKNICFLSSVKMKLLASTLQNIVSFKLDTRNVPSIVSAAIYLPGN
jgi:hypothetical protein